MIYGNVFLPGDALSSKNNDLFTVESVVYEEYCNRKTILESVSEGEDTSILEAELQVLAEVSISDIIEKIKNAWKIFRIKIVNVLNSIMDFVGSFIKNEKTKIKYNEFSKKASSFFRALNGLDKSDMVSYEILDGIKDKVENCKQYVINVKYNDDTEKIGESDIYNLRSKIDGIFKPFMDIYEDYLQEFLSRKEEVSVDKTEKVKKSKKMLIDFGISVTKEDLNKKENLNIENVDDYISKQIDVHKKIVDLAENDLNYYNKMNRDIMKSINNLSRCVSSLDATTKSENGVEVVKTYADHIMLQMNYLYIFTKKLRIMTTAMYGAYTYKIDFINSIINIVFKIYKKYDYYNDDTEKSETKEEAQT